MKFFINSKCVEKPALKLKADIKLYRTSANCIEICLFYIYFDTMKVLSFKRLVIGKHSVEQLFYFKTAVHIRSADNSTRLF